MKSFLKIAVTVFLFLAVGLITFRHFTDDFKTNPEAWRGQPDSSFISKAMDRAVLKNQAARRGKIMFNRWLGVRIGQYPTDLMLYQEAINDIKPDYIIETGTAYGGLTVFLAGLMVQMDLPGKVITIDIQAAQWDETLKSNVLPQKILDKIMFIKGSSTSDEVIQQIRRLVKNGKTIVILDSLHTPEHVRRELELYSQFIPIGGYLFVNDTVLGGPYFDVKHFRFEKRGPLYGVKSFLETNDQFILDLKRERFALSCMHSGILKRIK